MSQISSLNRVLEILKRLNEGKKVNIDDLSYEFDKSTRTIRRDFDLIKEVYNDFLIKDGEEYSAVNKNVLNDVLTGTDLATLTSIVEVFKNSGSKFKFDENIEKIFKQNKDIYQFTNKPFEQLKNKNITNKLEKSINYKQYIEIKYLLGTKNILETYKLKPYKILLLNDNFYLASATDDKYEYRILRINMIKEIKLENNTFYHDPKMKKFIENIQTPFAKYSQKEDIEVIISVPPQISRHFKMKKFLPSQRILKESKSGWVKISYKVTTLKEIEEFVEKWLPKIRIDSPKELSTRIEKKLESKLKNLKKVKEEMKNEVNNNFDWD